MHCVHLKHAVQEDDLELYVSMIIDVRSFGGRGLSLIEPRAPARLLDRTIVIYIKRERTPHEQDGSGDEANLTRHACFRIRCSQSNLKPLTLWEHLSMV